MPNLARVCTVASDMAPIPLSACDSFLVTDLALRGNYPCRQLMARCELGVGEAGF